MSNNRLYTPVHIHDTLMADPGHFWRKMQRCKADYDRLDPHPGVLPEHFHQWVLAEYGIEFLPAHDNFIASLCNIVDEQKYLLFELKYSG